MSLPANAPIHCAACGAVAMLTTCEVSDGDAVNADLFKHPDGRPAQDGDEIGCGTCGARFNCIGTRNGRGEMFNG
jgi:hypothetical protein